MYLFLTLAAPKHFTHIGKMMSNLRVLIHMLILQKSLKRQSSLVYTISHILSFYFLLSSLPLSLSLLSPLSPLSSSLFLSLSFIAATGSIPTSPVKLFPVHMHFRDLALSTLSTNDVCTMYIVQCLLSTQGFQIVDVSETSLFLYMKHYLW